MRALCSGNRSILLRTSAYCYSSVRPIHRRLQSRHVHAQKAMHGLQLAKAFMQTIRKGTLRKLYKTAMQMEVDFFSAQPGTSPPPAIRMLVVDFDDTCTATDTTSQIFNTATAATVESSADSEKADVQNRLDALKDELVQNYAQEQQKLYAELLPEGAAHPDGTNQQKATAFVNALMQFDRRMNQVVVDSGILRGIPHGRLKAAGEQIGLQAGCLTVLTRAQQAGVPTHIVSVNYSSEMVKATLQRGSLNIVTAEGASAEEHHDVVIHANELTYEQGISTGDIIRRVQGGSDKDALMTQLMHHTSQAKTDSTDGGDADAEANQLAVYIGDSPSDFAPLLRADLGIVVGQSKLLRQVAKAHSVKLLPLTAAPANGRGEEGSLYEAESWAAIGAFLFGPDPSKALTPHPGSGPGTKSGIKVPRVMTVAGSDSGGGAGIQADLKTYQARGVFGTSAISALTAQNTRGVRGVHTVPTQHLSDQMEAVLSDIGADVVKTGMLPTPEAVLAVADAVRAHKVSTLVVDPVLVATSGDSLAGSEVAQALKTHLFPLATIITPNLPEASALLGNRRVSDLATMKQAAKDLHKLGPKYVLIKGGHLIAAPSDPNRPSSDSHPSPSSPPSQTPSASSAAQDSESTSAQDHDTGQDATHNSDQPVSQLNADSSLREGHLHVQASSQHTDRDRAEQDLAQHNGAAESAAGEATPCGDPAEKHVSDAPAIDVLYDGQEIHVLESKRVHTHNTHGTGCTLASAIAAELAKGHEPLIAVQRAKAWLGEALQASAPLHIGTGPHRPLNHGFETTDWGQQKAPLDLQKPSLDFRLYAVTDPACNAKCQRSNAEAVRQAVKGGVTLVQLREKSADGGAFVHEAQQLMEITRPAGVGLIINDRIDVALAVGADGAHVGQDDIPAKAARALLGPHKILGVSVKTVEQAQQAAADGADYLGAGAMFQTATKDSSTISMEMLQQICKSVDIPVVAIGGMTAANARPTIEAGCRGVAVVSAIFGVEDATASAQQIRAVIDSATEGDVLEIC
ncbi:TPA: hypothetical protein ACH3X1_000888 [Trebouxia sp. C0004]